MKSEWSENITRWLAGILGQEKVGGDFYSGESTGKMRVSPPTRILGNVSRYLPPCRRNREWLAAKMQDFSPNSTASRKPRMPVNFWVAVDCEDVHSGWDPPCRNGGRDFSIELSLDRHFFSFLSRFQKEDFVGVFYRALSCLALSSRRGKNVE